MPRGVYKRKGRNPVEGLSTVYCAHTRKTYARSPTGTLCVVVDGAILEPVLVGISASAEQELAMYRSIVALLEELDTTMPPPPDPMGD